MLDYYFSRAYSQINALWDMKISNNSDLVPSSIDWEKKVLISIGGGERDHLVPSSLTFSHHSDIKTLVCIIFVLKYTNYWIYISIYTFRLLLFRGFGYLLIIYVLYGANN